MFIWRLAFSLCSWLVCLPVVHAGKSDPCQDRATSVLVDLNRGRLYLCEDSKTVAKYRVALGQGGVDKRVEGDKKTPVGTYSLGNGRASSEYYRFLSVGYPTSQQKKQGYTGSAIGIHGPKKGFERWGRLNSRVNWTHGCIAVATHRVIVEIENWVRDQGVRKIHLVND